MRTLVISDLHLGSAWRSDVLRRAELREPLLEEVRNVDRLVLLGDVLELRHGPPREALEAARPFFEDLGRSLAGRELVVVAGNHDHALIQPWLARRGEDGVPETLGVEQLVDGAEVSPLLERIAEWTPSVHVRAAYPGLWLRPNVYAMHGHYVDCHLTVPTLERLSVGAMSRLLGCPASEFSSVADYEAVTAPVYAWREAVARDVRTGDALNGVGTLRAWRALGGGGDLGRTAPVGGQASDGRVPSGHRSTIAGRIRTRALVGAFPLAVAALNRAGLGPLRAEISGVELRRAGLRAMQDVAARLGLGGGYVIFGHTHRSGPLPQDDQQEWGAGRAEPRGSGAQLLNTGCWIYTPLFLTDTPGESPYWPGRCVLVEESGPPLLKGLLADRTHEQLRPPRG